MTLFVLLAGWDYATQPPFYAIHATQMTIFVTTLWTSAVPLVVLTVGAKLIARVRSVPMRHLGLTALSAAVVAILPFFAILSLCASNMFCP
jgi:hypothetical protein